MKTPLDGYNKVIDDFRIKFEIFSELKELQKIGRMEVSKEDFYNKKENDETENEEAEKREKRIKILEKIKSRKIKRDGSKKIEVYVPKKDEELKKMMKKMLMKRMTMKKMPMKKNQMKKMQMKKNQMKKNQMKKIPMKKNQMKKMPMKKNQMKKMIMKKKKKKKKKLKNVKKKKNITNIIFLMLDIFKNYLDGGIQKIEKKQINIFKKIFQN